MTTRNLRRMRVVLRRLGRRRLLRAAALISFGIACTLGSCRLSHGYSFCTTYEWGFPFSAAGDYCPCDRGPDGFAIRPEGILMDVAFYSGIAWGLTTLGRSILRRIRPNTARTPEPVTAPFWDRYPGPFGQFMRLLIAARQYHRLTP
jgi:hypothetical protein